MEEIALQQLDRLDGRAKDIKNIYTVWNDGSSLEMPAE